MENVLGLGYNNPNTYMGITIFIGENENSLERVITDSHGAISLTGDVGRSRSYIEKISVNPAKLPNGSRLYLVVDEDWMPSVRFKSDRLVEITSLEYLNSSHCRLSPEKSKLVYIDENGGLIIKDKD